MANQGGGSDDDATPVQITDSEAQQLLQDAEDALATGDYQKAIVDSGKAAYALHEDSRVHEVLWLALFGVAD
jgi:hypothetical protein